MTTAPPLLDIKQAAAHLGISRQYLYRLVSEKKISFVRIGTNIRFAPSDLQDWIDSKRVPAVTQ